VKVLIAGAGLMGAQIGVEYALGGHAVTFFVRDEASAAKRVVAAFETAARYGLGESNEPVSFATTIARIDEPDLIVESLPENLEQKLDVLRPIVARFPNAIVASNTSSISITKIGDGIGAGERTVGTHYWNPPLLMPMVEVISGDRTDPAVIDRVTDVLKELRKRPVIAKRDVPGFIWNRLQLALLREAVWIVENGVADPATVDETVRDGLAKRWRLTGPFETVALGGGATFERIARNLFPVLSDAQELCDLDRWLIHDPKELSRIKVRRDEALAAQRKDPEH
jgi:3-hydroxybutyryl-CoA dehydrogenase